MEKTVLVGFLLFALLASQAQNVGIGLGNPSAKLHVNGGIKINGNNQFELGAGIATKEPNAGKIAYQNFSDALDIVGAGTTINERKIKLWSEGGTTVAGTLTLEGALKFSGYGKPNMVIQLQLGQNMYQVNGTTLGDNTTTELVRIDHPLANGNPNAFIIANARTRNGIPPSLMYLSHTGFWYLAYHSSVLAGGATSIGTTQCNTIPCTYVVAMTPMSGTFKEGMQYNVFIIP